MPLLNTIMYVMLHVLIAVALNVFANWLGWIQHAEVFCLYFVVLCGRLFDAQARFTLAYKEDPRLVEKLLREQLSNERTDK